MNFQIVHVRAVGVNLGAYGMPGAMNEVPFEAFVFNVSSHRVIHFPPRKALICGHSFQHGFHSDVSRLANDIEDLKHTARRSVSDETSPCDVVVHASWG